MRIQVLTNITLTPEEITLRPGDEITEQSAIDRILRIASQITTEDANPIAVVIEEDEE